MGDTDDYAYLMVVMIKRHDNKVDGWSWFKAIRGREKRDTEVWMLISINAIDDDEDLMLKKTALFLHDGFP